MITFYAVNLQKLSFTDENFKTLISLKRHISNIKHCIHKSYEKAHFGLHSNNETTLLKKKTILRNLLKNLIL